MAVNRPGKIIKLAILCVFAAVMNFLLSYFFMNFLKFPLFLDTVFTVAVAFSAGLIPGIIVALLSQLVPYIYFIGFNFYVLCSIAEVFLVCALKPVTPEISGYAPKEKIFASYTGVAAKLFLLYIVCAINQHFGRSHKFRVKCISEYTFTILQP